ncbi:hypothetical protein COS83_03320 [archaeon CG07_land_8_20_14_0_80_38_8]|nr:MAG: hypothetical protein COS83_03320 [archaeon CG07_land_8_20_14_0_80_38_8]PIU88244.1 MAG: hypothetical protein COS64_04370 [archaeon CG06_land_8_20_14_3_00_37_11]
MNLFYLKRGKEEIMLSHELLNNFNDDKAMKLVTHLSKSMNFMIDFMNNKHVEMPLEFAETREKVKEVMGDDFIDTLFYLNSLNNNSIRVLNSSNILINTKIINQVDKSHFENLVSQVINYFNNLYEKTEQGLMWH